MDKKYKKLGKNTIIVLVGSIGSKLINIFMLPFYTSFLSTTEFGNSDIILTYSNVLYAIVTCCLADSVLLFCKNADVRERTYYFTSGLVFGILFLICFAIICFFIKCYSMHNPNFGTFGNDIWWIFFMTLSMFMQSYVQQFTLSVDKVVVYSLSGIVLTASLAILGVCLVPSLGFKGYMSSLIIANILTSVFNFIYSKAYNYISVKRFDSYYIRRLLCYSLPLIPNSMMWFLLNGINRPIMESNIGLEAIGIYAVANRFPGIIAMLCTVFSNAWGLSILEEFHSPQFNNFFNKTMKLLFIIMVFGCCFMTFFSRTIIEMFSSNEYYEAWRYLPILTLAAVFQNLASLIGSIFMAEKKSVYFFYTSLVGAFFSIILTILLGRIWGLMGFCVAVACAFFFMLTSRVILAWKHINMMNVRYYTWMFIFLIFLIICITLDIDKIYNVTTFILVLAIMFFMNMEEINGSFRIIIKKCKLLSSK